MDTSYLTSQVATVVNSLHALFDDIGVPSHDREAREAALFAALSETLQSQLRLVTAEKNALHEEANKLILSIKQMNRSLDDNGRESGNSIISQNNDFNDDDESNGLTVTYPLKRCVDGLKEKHVMVNKLHAQRFEQVKKLAHALNTYAQQMESGFVQIGLPNLNSPTTTFKMPPSYMHALDQEFSRVYEEYTRRMATVKALSTDIVQLWAELGTPSAQTELAIVECCRGTTEQIGVREDDLARLRLKKEKLINEKKAREKRVSDLKIQIEHLWERLGADENETRAFMANHRGCNLRTIQQWEQELVRLNEIKKANLHIFVEDARQTLQDLWDNLYFSEEEMLEFTPAFSDVYTDALLEAHELEIARLQQLLDERAPLLAMVEKHQTLINDRQSLEMSSQDSSRLLARGPRDPTRLLREEKMRKRIAKELPKLESELLRALEEWDDRTGRQLLINGTPYLDTVIENQKPVKSNLFSSSTGTRNLDAPKSVQSRPTPSTKATGGSIARSESSASARTGRQNTKTPTPSFRAPLGNLNTGSNSPERRPAPSNGRKTPVANGSRTPTSKTPNGTIGRSMPAYMVQSTSQAQKVAPPKMRALDMPPPSLQPHRQENQRSRPVNNQYRPAQARTNQVEVYEPEEIHDTSYHSHSSHEIQTNTISRVPSGNSTVSHATGASSENWETFGEDSEDDEPDARQTYYEKLRAAKGGKRGYEQAHYPGTKRPRSLNGMGRNENIMEEEVVDNDDSWSDEAF